jgi:hypothetical protein
MTNAEHDHSSIASASSSACGVPDDVLWASSLLALMPTRMYVMISR